MGLIGYVNDETQRRSKEIAIRKVNGAEASNYSPVCWYRDISICFYSFYFDSELLVAYFIGKGMVGTVCRNRLILIRYSFVGYGFSDVAIIIVAVCRCLRHGISLMRIR